MWLPKLLSGPPRAVRLMEESGCSTRPYTATGVVNFGRRSGPVPPTDTNLHVVRYIGAEHWPDGGRDFAPPSLRPTPSRAGWDGTGRDAGVFGRGLRVGEPQRRAPGLLLRVRPAG